VASSSPDSMPDLTYGGNLLTSISDGLDAANGDLVPSAESWSTGARSWPSPPKSVQQQDPR
jgi:hypothetical protein